MAGIQVMVLQILLSIVVLPQSMAAKQPFPGMLPESKLMAREAERTLPARDLSAGDSNRKALFDLIRNNLRQNSKAPIDVQAWLLRGFKDPSDGTDYFFMNGQVKRKTSSGVRADTIAVLYKKADGKISIAKTMVGFDNAPYDCFFLGSKTAGLPALPPQLFGYAGSGEYHAQHTARCMQGANQEDLGRYTASVSDTFADTE